MKTIIVILVLMLVGCEKESVVESPAQTGFESNIVLAAKDTAIYNFEVVGISPYRYVRVRSSAEVLLIANGGDNGINLRIMELGGIEWVEFKIVNLNTFQVNLDIRIQ
jgi:hypothetical protein